MMSMSERPRMYFDVDDRLRWALRREAGNRNMPSVAALVKAIVEDALSEQLAEVDRRIAEGESPAQGKSARGRKPKKKPHRTD
jgi:hypothetical protein